MEVAVPPDDKVTGFWEKVAVMPSGGGLLDRSMSPENESTLLSVMVELPEDPSGITSFVGFALMPKSGGTTKVSTVRVAVADPLTPVTLTL